jgi:hypothetical protein
MRLFQFAVVSALCCCPAVAVHCDDYEDSDAMSADQANNAASTVIPVPEARSQYNSPTPVDAVVVDKDGNMTQTQYTYDPNQGGVVINNYYQVGGPDASIYFPLWGIGFLWWSGFWVDSYGYYWNGYGYGYVRSARWGNHWNNYWHSNWNNKWNNYHGGNRGNYQHNGGVNRPANHARSGGGGRARGGGGGHGGHGGLGGGRR